MELTERKRSRKSQSFKLVNQDYHDVYKGNENSNGEHTLASSFLGDEGMEIKKQITGMRRLLNDSTGRVYQRVGEEGENIKEELQDSEVAWVHPLNPSPEIIQSTDPPQRAAWSSTSPIGHFSAKYGTRSKDDRNLMKTAEGSNAAVLAKIAPNECFQCKCRVLPCRQRIGTGQLSVITSYIKINGVTCLLNYSKLHNVPTELFYIEYITGEIREINSLAGSNCCTCNCQTTLQAILEELKAIRKCMQLQAGAQIKQQPTIPSVCASRSTLSRKRIKKRKAPLRIVPPIAIQKPHLENQGRRQLRISGMPSLTRTELNTKVENHASRFGIVKESSASDPEVQLAEGFDVLMHKSQLDSILSNYTRSGSLLFRKLVCAFFDDNTLANSLPNGKRKRGLNDNRKGLDQNIVGAIKVFTEKYCSANRVDKVPGPRDWVQILQDQIKLARRRLKRGTDSAEAVECEGETNVLSTRQTGNLPQSNSEEMWVAEKQGCSM